MDYGDDRSFDILKNETSWMMKEDEEWSLLQQSACNLSELLQKLHRETNETSVPARTCDGRVHMTDLIFIYHIIPIYNNYNPLELNPISHELFYEC